MHTELPREAGLQVATRGERLACLDDIQVLGVDVGVLREVEVLLRNENALCGDRVSAYPAAKSYDLCRVCHSHGS